MNRIRMKYSKALVERLCEILATGKYTIVDSCTQVGISESAYYKWKRTKPEFAAAVEEAQSKRLEQYNEMALSGFAKLLDMHEYEEVTTEYENDKEGNPRIKSQKRVQKKIMPNVAAVIFTLSNRDPKNWRNRQDHTTKGEKIESASLFLKLIMESSQNRSENEASSSDNPT